MPLSAAQIVSIAAQQAKVPNYTSQAGQLLNYILSDLCQTYDFDVAKGTYVFNFSTSQPTNPAVYPNVLVGGGPYPLPTDFLRMVDDKDAMWFLLGVPYPMIPCDLSEYDNLVQQAGLESYPYILATDMSQTPPNLLIYPPASGNYQAMIRYRRQMPDITTPEVSSVVPWFPNQQYLVTRLSGELMRISDDERAEVWLGDGDIGAVGILRKYLQMKDDDTNRAKMVKLDRRSFGRKYSTLPFTKTVGWVFALAFGLQAIVHMIG